MKSSLLLNTFGVFLLISITINSAFANIDFIKYELSATEVDFTSSTDDQSVILTLTVDSQVPVTYIQSSFERADGKNIYGGGNGINQELQKGIQTIKLPLRINAWGGDGDYKVKGIVFQTSQEEKLELQEVILIKVKGTRKVTTPPKITSYDVIKTVETPQNVVVTLHIESEAPPGQLCSSIDNPDNQNLQGGCWGQTLNDPTQIITSFALEKCFKEDKAGLEGEKITFQVDVTSPNCPKGEPQCDLISVKSNYPNNKISEIGTIQLTLVVQSTSDLYYTNSLIISPTGQTIQGGGNQISQLFYSKTPIQNDPRFQYELQFFSYSINIWSIRGIYKYQDLKIQNEQLVWTQPKSLEIEVAYPQSPWIEVVMDIKDKEGSWKQDLEKVVEDFVKQKEIQTPEIYLQEKQEKRLRFLQGSTTPQIQLFIGKLESNKFESILNDKEFFQTLQGKFVVSASVSSSDKTKNIPTPAQQQQIAEKNTQISLILSSFIFMIFFLL